MATADIYVTEGDLLPSPEFILEDRNGPVNLGASTVKFLMRNRGISKVDASATVVSAADGQVRYDWTGTDTDTPGWFEAEWEVTETASSKTWTFPNDGYLSVYIKPKAR